LNDKKIAFFVVSERELDVLQHIFLYQKIQLLNKKYLFPVILDSAFWRNILLH